MIDASKYVAHKSPGKFEGESAATEYFYEQMCNGDGEDIHASDFAESDEAAEAQWESDNDPIATLFQVSAEEAEAFELTCGHWFLLREDSQGFAFGSEHATREEAEQRFRDEQTS